ncbi:MAG: S8 family serine peptidase [Smithella sp.]
MSRKRKKENEQANEISFFVRFSIYAIVFFIAVILLPGSFYAPINRLTAILTGMLLGVFGMPIIARGEYLFAGGLSVWVVPECTPVFMILIFAAFLFSFPATSANRIKGLIAGVPFLMAADILRLGLTIALGAAKPLWFNYIHAYIGQIWSILILIAACHVWVCWCGNIRKPGAAGRFLIEFAVVSSILFIVWIPLNQNYIMAGDVLLKFLFSLFSTKIIFAYQHEIYYHTINLVVFGALVLADDGMTRRSKTRALLIGMTVLAAFHLVFRVLNVFLYGYGWTAFLPVATTIHITMQLLVPVVLWLTLGGGLSIRQQLMTINYVKAHASRPVIISLMLFGLLVLSQPLPACAQARLIDEAGILRGFNKSQANIRVIVNLVDPGQENLARPERRVTRRQNVRWIQNRVFMGLNANRVKLKRGFDYHAGFAAEVTREGLEDLRRHGDVVSIELDRKLQIHTAQGIPLMNASAVRETYNGQGVAIAIVDTGIDYTHPKLSAKVIGGYNFGDDTTDPMDLYGHGTSCAGIVAGDTGTTGDYIGGVAYGAKLYAVKVSHGSTGEAYASDMIAGWEWCITHQNDNPDYPIMIINTSMGFGGFTAACDSYSTAMTSAAANAVAAGITIFASSGNNGYCNAMAWPSCLSSVIAVGAVFDASLGTLGFCVDASSCAPNQGTHAFCSPNPVAWSYSITPDRETPYSNTAPILGLLAPSHNAYTTAKGGGYVSTFGGTSAASPYAAGAAAILQSAAKAKLGSFLSPADVRSILVSTGDPVTDVKINYGKKRINIEAAVNALTSEPVPALDYVGFLALLPALGVIAVWGMRRKRLRNK